MSRRPWLRLVEVLEKIGLFDAPCVVQETGEGMMAFNRTFRSICPATNYGSNGGSRGRNPDVFNGTVLRVAQHAEREREREIR